MTSVVPYDPPARVLVSVFCLVLLSVAFAAPSSASGGAATTPHQAVGWQPGNAAGSPVQDASPTRSVIGLLRQAGSAPVTRLQNDGSLQLQRLRLAGGRAPDELQAIVVLCDFSDSLMYGRWGQVPGDFPPPRQSDFYYAAHDSVYFDHLLGDVADYFSDVSDAQFTLNYTVHERVINLPHPMGWYGNHPEEGEQPIRLAADVVDSLDGEIDFVDYDTVVLIHAGAGGETDILGNSPEQIFSTYLSPEDFRRAVTDSILMTPYLPTSTHPDGEGVDHVLVLPETEFQDSVPSFGGFFGSLGVYCFEVGLRLGMLSLSDFTPPGRPDSQGIGEFGLMGFGLFVGAGYIPAHPCAFNKLLMGWAEPYAIDADAGGTYRLVPVESAADPLALARVEISGQEYWLLAYRLQDTDGNGIFSFPGDLNANNIPDFYDADSDSGDGTPTGYFDPATDTRERLEGGEWDFFMSENTARAPGVKAAGSGLYIWHVDEGVIHAAFGAQSNLFNADPQRKSVDLEEADGIQDLDTRVGSPYLLGGDDDSYRGEDNATFGPDTRPDTRSAGGATTGVIIDAISNVVVDSMFTWPDFREGVLYADTMSFHCRREVTDLGAPQRSAELVLTGVDLSGSHLLAVDLDSDDSAREIVAAGRAGELFALTTELTEYVDPDGDPATVLPLTVGRDAAGEPVRWNLPVAVGDLDGDDALEFVLTGPDGLYAFERDGSAVVPASPPAHGLHAALSGCALPPLLLPTGSTPEAIDPAGPVVACVVEIRTEASYLRFFDGTGADYATPLSLGPVVVTAPVVRLAGTSGNDLLCATAIDTAAGEAELVLVDWGVGVSQPAVVARLPLSLWPGSFPPLVAGSDDEACVTIVGSDGEIERLCFAWSDYVLSAPAQLWSDRLTTYAPLGPDLAVVGAGVHGVAASSGVWLNGWPRRPQPDFTVSPAAQAAQPLAAIADGSRHLFASEDGRIYLYDRAGTLQPGWPVAGPSATAGTGLLIDLERDDSLDLVAVGTAQRIGGVADDGESLQTEPVSRLTIWADLGVWTSQTAMWGGSPWRGGVYGAAAPESPPAAGTALIDAGSHICYPSPLVEATLWIRAQVRDDCRVRATIYNLEGEEVTATDVTDVNGGSPFEIAVDLARVASGLYICRLTAEGVDGGREQSVKTFAVVR